ncbi:uncharacterized protein LOC110699108 isoform X2 [Chenopodium quinoa]|uniref:uncharacterized protein LOC110699108 isoform X2 n=1 Tax=Chenopodium quinoa TaxID=63459 RepID=UPI000B793C93|nr:uncharacterized protein LOC110699108 isoform X2 [Chenopodium quinoa]
MIIEQLSDAQQSSSERTFWGIKVLPKKPVTVRLPNNSFNCLHISQATAECSNSENMYNKNRTLVSVKCDGKNKILICSLGVKRTIMATLGLEFSGPCDMVFSLRGRRGVHLVGHFYNRITSPTNFVAPPIMDNGGGGGRSIKTHGHGIADFVGEAVKEKGGTSVRFKFLLPGLIESFKQIPVSLEEKLEAQTATIIDAIENKLGNQDVVLEEKQQGEKERTKKGENKCLPIAPEIDHGDNHEGSKKRKRRKSNKLLPITNEIECENNESSVRRKLDYVLPVKEVQPADRNVKESEKNERRKGRKSNCQKLMVLKEISLKGL